MFKSTLSKFTGLMILLLNTALVQAQNASDPIEMADSMQESGKIYVVVGVLLIIFLGFLAYLVMKDRKISKLEQEINEKKG